MCSAIRKSPSASSPRGETARRACWSPYRFSNQSNKASYDLRVDYTQPPVPPLSDEDAEWAAQVLQGRAQVL